MNNSYGLGRQNDLPDGLARLHAPVGKGGLLKRQGEPDVRLDGVSVADREWLLRKTAERVYVS